MDKLTFTSAQLLSFTRDAKGGTATFSSSMNGNVERAMGWTDIPSCATGANLEGELSASIIQLVPEDQPLRRHEMQLDVSRVNSFQVVRRELEGTRQKGHRHELRFKVHYSDVKGARKLEEYILTCGKSKVVVSYTKQAVQEDLPGVELDEADDQERLISEEQAEETTVEDEGATLAPAVLVGGSHQRATRKLQNARKPIEVQ